MDAQKPRKKDRLSHESKYIKVLDANIHYIEEGHGQPILFLHGMPASNYLWRNVIPHVAKHGRCIAPDLIGMGKSDKPNIEYRISDHIKYIESFIDALKLKNITLVMQGWGSVIGFDYAMRHEDNVKGLVFFEAHLRPMTNRRMMSLPMQELITAIDSFDEGMEAILHEDRVNKVIEDWLRLGAMRSLTNEEVSRYQEPFSKPEHRKVLKGFFEDMVHGHNNGELGHLIAAYSDKLKKSHLPKLMFYAIPGFNTTVDTIVWAKNNLKNLTVEDMGEDLHFVQETQPEAFGQKVANWLQQLLPEAQQISLV